MCDSVQCFIQSGEIARLEHAVFSYVVLILQFDVDK